jgi:hypothetical protein
MSVFKSLVKLAAVTSVAGAIAVSPIFTLKAEALTEAQALERLGTIPVFMIIDDKGELIFGSMPQQPNAKPDDSQILFLFLGPDEAKMMLGQVQKSNPAVGTKAQIFALPMKEALKLMQENKDKKVVFPFIPSKSSIDSARTILTSQGVAADKIPNIPVFFATGGKAESQSLLTMSRTDQNGKQEQIVPFFLDKADLQNELDIANKVQPDVVKATKIQVTSLFRVLDLMITKDNKPNPDVERFNFIPSSNAVKYVQTNQPVAPQTAPPSAPQTTPPSVAPSAPRTIPPAPANQPK